MKKIILLFFIIFLGISNARILKVGDCEYSEEVAGTWYKMDELLWGLQDNDTVVVCPGTHPSINARISKKNVTIKSISGNPEDTILNGIGSVVFFLHGSNTKIQNLTLKSDNVVLADDRLTIFAPEGYGALTLENLIIESSSSKNIIDLSHSHIDNVQILNSHIDAEHGTGAYLRSSSKTMNVNIQNSTISAASTALAMDGGQILHINESHLSMAEAKKDRAALFVKDVPHVKLLKSCLSGGESTFMIKQGVKNVEVKDTNFWASSKIFDSSIDIEKFFGTNQTVNSGNSIQISSNETNLNVSKSCIFNDIDSKNADKNKLIFNANYYDDTKLGVSLSDSNMQRKCYGENLKRCTGLVSEHKFDKCDLQSGSEALDTIASKYNGTLQGYIFTDPSPEENQVCQNVTLFEYGNVEIPNVSDVLNKTASLAFWMRSTQKVDTALSAFNSPGIFGLKDKIYWGWINFEGRIGMGQGTQLADQQILRLSERKLRQRTVKGFEKEGLSENEKVEYDVFGVESYPDVTDGAWHHIVLQRDAKKNRFWIYIDGKFNKKGDFLASVDLSDAKYSKLGKIEGTDAKGFEGSLDEVKIYDRIISESEIRQIYLNEKLGKNYDGSTPECDKCQIIKKCYSDGFSQQSQKYWTFLSNKEQSHKGLIPYYYHGRLMFTVEPITQWSSATQNFVPDFQASGAVYEGSFPSKNNTFITEFDYYGYGISIIQGAGIAVVFSDANITATLGGTAGSLGYAPRATIVGQDNSGFGGGWIGVGLDQYGGYSPFGIGKTGGHKDIFGNYSPALVPNAIAVRGSWKNNYIYLNGTQRLPYWFAKRISAFDLTGKDYPYVGYKPGREGYGFKFRLVVNVQDDQTVLTVSRKSKDNCVFPGDCWERLANMNISQTGLTPENLRLSFTGTTEIWPASSNQGIDNLIFSAKHCGDMSRVIEHPNNRIDAQDSFREQSDKNISTKIVNEPFEITTYIYDENKTKLVDFNGTMCAQIVEYDEKNGKAIPKPLVYDDKNQPTWQRWFVNENTKGDKKTHKFTFNSPISTPNARVRLMWVDNAQELCPIFGDVNSTYSADNFAIRPNNFEINAPQSVVAGESFNLEFLAKDKKNNNTKGYNESVGLSFKVSYQDQKDKKDGICITGELGNNLSKLVAFQNGYDKKRTKYSEVGVLDINISDLHVSCDDLYARVDCKDKNVAGYFDNNITTRIKQAVKSIDFTLSHFDLNSTLQDFTAKNHISTDQNFTYFSNLDLSKKMYAHVGINALAKNKDGNITQNYSNLCYANDGHFDVKLKMTKSPITPSGAVSKMTFYNEDTNLSTQSDVKDDVAINYEKKEFDKGVGEFKYKFNFNRSAKKPIDPLLVQLVNTDITDTNAIVAKNSSANGRAFFVYGRVNLGNIKTNIKNFDQNIEYEIFRQNGSQPGFLQNSLYWYRNKLHNATNQDNDITVDFDSKPSTLGYISALYATKVGGNFNFYDTSSYNISVKSFYKDVKNGVQEIKMKLTSSDKVQNYSLHAHIPSWLWYTDGLADIAYNKFGTCKYHPCFNLEYENVAGELESGDFTGSDVNLSKYEANESIQRGTKVFR